MTEPLFYKNGTEIDVGDHVTFSGGHYGVVTLLIGGPEAGEGIISSEWNYLENGILMSTQFGIIHYEDSQLDMIELKSKNA